MKTTEFTDSHIKDVVLSPQGGVLLIFANGKKAYKPSPEWYKRYGNHKSESLKVKSFISIRMKRERDMKVFCKYIVPNLFRSMNIKMPAFEGLNVR